MKENKKTTIGVFTTVFAYLRIHVVLSVLLTLLITGCRNEQPEQVIPPAPVSSAGLEIASNQPPPSAWDSYKAGTCLTLSEFLHETFLYSGLNQKYKDKPILQQSKTACEKLLADDPNNLQIIINLISSKKQLLYYTTEKLKADKVEQTVRQGVTEGLEDARLLMAMMVGGDYFKDNENRLELLLPLLKSKDPKMLAVVGVLFQLPKSARYDSINLVTAYKYLPMKLFEEAKSLNNLLARNSILGSQYRLGLNHKLAALAFQRAWDINKDILAGYRLGVYYMDGKGVKYDAAKALELLHSVVERGAPNGHFELGLFYTELNSIGNKIKGFEKSDKKAIAYFEQGTKNGGTFSKKSLIVNYLDTRSPFYNKKRGTYLYCTLPAPNRPKETILSRQRIKINCDSVKQEQ